MTPGVAARGRAASVRTAHARHAAVTERETVAVLTLPMPADALWDLS